MATTYKLIDKVVVGLGGVTSIDFTSIPSTYTDLVLKVSARDGAGLNAGGDNLNVTINGSSSSIYSEKMLYANSTTPNSLSSSSTTLFQDAYSNGASTTANTFSSVEYYFSNYASSNNKSISIDSVVENNSSSSNAYILNLTASLFASSTAISRITIAIAGSATIAQYSSAYLYGIKNS
jgi:hypothetical protein